MSAPAQTGRPVVSQAAHDLIANYYGAATDGTRTGTQRATTVAAAWDALAGYIATLEREQVAAEDALQKEKHWRLTERTERAPRAVEEYADKACQELARAQARLSVAENKLAIIQNVANL